MGVGWGVPHPLEDLVPPIKVWPLPTPTKVEMDHSHLSELVLPPPLSEWPLETEYQNLSILLKRQDFI